MPNSPLTAKEILAIRASAPNNWSGLSQAQINRLLKANIAAWRANAYARGLEPQLSRTYGFSVYNLPHAGVGYKNRMRYRTSAAPVASSYNRNSRTGRLTVTAKKLGGRRQNAFNTIRKFIGKRLTENERKRLREAAALTRKHKQATKIQAFVRGALTRARIEKYQRASYVKKQNGSIVAAYRPHRASAFLALGKAIRSNKKIRNAARNQAARNWAAAHPN
jgi:hypothetical protein